MAIVLIVETGQSATNSNTYVSITDIDAWVLTNPHDVTWTVLTDAQKKGYAVMSCRILDERVDWEGWQSDQNQALDLPRSGMTDKNGNSIDSDEIPVQVKNAQCELARLLAISNRTADSDMKGFKEIQVGKIKLVADKGDKVQVLADPVWKMIQSFGLKLNPKGICRVFRI